ncbi:MAG: hypothetical protein WAN89_01375 [Lawsonella sp.]
MSRIKIKISVILNFLDFKIRRSENKYFVEKVEHIMSNCEINSSRIENLAVTAVNGLLLKNKYIAPDIKTNDRTPVLDGSIFIYSSSKQTKKHLKGQLPVQIKGRTVSDVESVAQFPIEKDLVKNFYALGGALFILVHISKKDPEKKSIFFTRSLKITVKHS